MFGIKVLPFTRKRLIHSNIYTQYAHQPNEGRTRQFNKCLAAVGGDRPFLTWLFLNEIWECALDFHNAGVVIAKFYDRYCQSRNITPTVLPSLQTDHPGFGMLEKKADQETRILREKAEELARALWEQAGRPVGGHAAWVKPALEQLKAAIGQG